MIELLARTRVALEPVDVVVTVERVLGHGDVAFPETSEMRRREARVRVGAALASLPGRIPTDCDLVVRHRVRGLPFEHEAPLDLAAAVGCVLALGRDMDVDRAGFRYIGELSLGGVVLPVRGAAVLADGADAVISRESAPELLFSEHRRIFVSSLSDAIRHEGGPPLTLPSYARPDVSGAKLLRRDGSFHDGSVIVSHALEIIRRGSGVLLMGRPGSGKTILARMIALELGISGWSDVEKVATMRKIHSVAGFGVLRVAPFRAPHHTVSQAGMVGNARQPGEVSLAHGDVLFLDEFGEFRASVIADLVDAIGRGSSHGYPSRPTIIAAAAPCPCGGHRVCKCTLEMIARHVGRLPTGALGLEAIDVEALP